MSPGIVTGRAERFRGWASALALVIASALGAGELHGQDGVVSSARGQWGRGEGWRLGAEPTVELGSSGDPSEDFGDIQAVAQLADGSLVVADRMAGELRVFDPSGRFVRRLGRSGEGPGEFKGVSSLQILEGDSIAAFDPPLRRWTVFSKSGDVLGSHTFRSSSLPGVGMAYRHGDGDFTFTGSVLVAPGGEAGYFDTTVPLFSYEVSSGRVIPLGDMPGRQLYRTRGGALGRVLVLRSASIAVGDRIFIGNGRSWEIQVLSRDGTPLARWRRLGVDLSLSSGRLGAAERTSLEPMGKEPQTLARWRRLYAEAPRPDSVPAYSEFLLDSEGFLWVRGYALVGEPQPAWSVFDPSGAYLGDVQVPERFDIKAVERGTVLGVWRDDYDVQHVRAYALEGRR